jgi:hypothetical protein
VSHSHLKASPPMTASKRLFRLVAVTIATAAPTIATAQSGSLSGVVIERARHIKLEGAAVSLAGTTLRKFTDRLGRFQFDSVPPGLYRMLVIRVGYAADSSTIVHLHPGERLEITAELGPSDSCQLAREQQQRQWKGQEEQLHAEPEALSKRLRLPALTQQGTGWSEVRYWDMSFEQPADGLLRIRRGRTRETAELFRWWPAEPDSSGGAMWAAAYRAAAFCDRLWLTSDSTYYVCRITLKPQDVEAFSVVLAQTRTDLLAHGPLPPLASTACEFPSTIVIDAPLTVVQIADTAGIHSVGLRSSLGVWPNTSVVLRLYYAFQLVSATYYVQP